MHYVLTRHPQSPSLATAQIEVEAVRPRADNLVLSYTVKGKMLDICMPPIVASTRGEELWRHTCFEAFVGESPGTAYYEFNFAPSTQWAAYQFTSYRRGMRAAEMRAPTVEIHVSPECYRLDVSLELDLLPTLSRKTSWRLGLSAVIEDTSGRMSYWALTHPSEKPDFHHADCFTQEFPPASSS